MIRFQLITKVSGTACFVGWNSKRSTYFAEVRRQSRRVLDEPETLLQLGQAPGECQSIKRLEAAIAPWADLPLGTRQLIMRERLGRPTLPLQSAARGFARAAACQSVMR
jgi:hypothetical protein